SQGIELARVGLGLPAGPLELRESDRGFERQWAVVDLGPGHGGTHRGHGAGQHVGNEDVLARGIEADVGRRLEAVRQQHRLLPGPRNDENFAALPVAHIEPAKYVPGETIAAAEAARDLLRLSGIDANAMQVARAKIQQQKMRLTVKHQTIGRMHGRMTLRVGDDTDFALGIDAVDSAPLALEIARIADIY